MVELYIHPTDVARCAKAHYIYVGDFETESLAIEAGERMKISKFGSPGIKDYYVKSIT